MICRATAFAATAFVLMATAAGAAPTKWHCEVTDKNAPPGVPPNYLITYDRGTGEALVADGLIMHVKKAPIPAKVSAKSDQLTFGWTVTRVPGSGGTALSVRFSLSINEKTNAMMVNQKILGYDNFPLSARGTCRTVK